MKENTSYDLLIDYIFKKTRSLYLHVSLNTILILAFIAMNTCSLGTQLDKLEKDLHECKSITSKELKDENNNK